MERTANGLVVPDGNGHQSASQRQIHALKIAIEFWQKAAAAMLVLHGGDVVLPVEALNIPGQIETRAIPGGGCRLRMLRPGGFGAKPPERMAVCPSCEKQYPVSDGVLPSCGVCAKPTEWLVAEEGPLSCEGPPS